MHITLHGSNVCMRASLHLHVIHDERLIVRSLSVSSCLSFSCFSLLFTSFSHQFDLHSAQHSFFHVDNAEGNTRCAFAQRGVLHLAICNPPTGYEPNVLDDFHFSETSAMIFQEESGDIDTEPSYLCDAELDDETTGKALSSPLFIQEREEPASGPKTSLSLS